MKAVREGPSSSNFKLGPEDAPLPPGLQLCEQGAAASRAHTRRNVQASGMPPAGCWTRSDSTLWAVRCSPQPVQTPLTPLHDLMAKEGALEPLAMRALACAQQRSTARGHPIPAWEGVLAGKSVDTKEGEWFKWPVRVPQLQPVGTRSACDA